MATECAEIALLAGNRYQVLEMAGVAAHPQEAVPKTAALEVRFELLMDIQGQAYACQTGRQVL